VLVAPFIYYCEGLASRRGSKVTPFLIRSESGACSTVY